MSDRTRVILAGATGWAGAALARGIGRAADLQLVAAVARRYAGQSLADVLGEPALTAPIHADAGMALRTACDVFVEFTKPDSAKANILAALAAGVHVVVGTSGLSDDDYGEIDRAARARERGVLACGNFALTVVLLQRFAEIAARYLDHFEIIDTAHEDKPDAPSGTARELAFRLGRVKQPHPGVVLDQVRGPVAARGATLNGVQVHSVRLPGYVIGVEAIFGAPGQRLHLSHHAGSSAEPYVDGALLAIRKVSGLRG
ncbi:MAG TPA: 4-hydroxy-tetrahydrodipicolinate reductase, partial [Burkholderiaceae bacterium]|nr:4-hydroxy-tetrahydrodipicolinate reductase [Burkholderiaceae bacterium]